MEYKESQRQPSVLESGKLCVALARRRPCCWCLPLLGPHCQPITARYPWISGPDTFSESTAPPPGYPIYGRDLPCYLSYSALFFFFLVLITSCACACVCLPPWVVSSGTARAGIVGSPPYAQWLVQLPTCITLHARLLNESMIERRLDQSFPRCMQSGRGRKPLLFAELCLHTVILRATLVDGFV